MLRRRVLPLLAFVLAAQAVAAPAAAQAPPAAETPPAADQSHDPCGGAGRLLATLNRPTVGYSACAIPRGTVVLEEGYQINAQGGPAASVYAQYPQGFERVGVAKRFELDLIGPNVNRLSTAAGLSTGLSDMGAGFKYEFQPKTRFTYAVDGLYTAPTGAAAFTAGGPTETLNLDVAYALSPSVGLGTTLAAVSTGGARQDGTFGRFGAFDPSFVVTAQMPHEYQLYAELVGQSRIAPDLGGRWYTDFGVQKLVGRDFEIDVEEGVDFTPVLGSRFTYTGVGFGVLLP